MKAGTLRILQIEHDAEAAEDVRRNLVAGLEQPYDLLRAGDFDAGLARLAEARFHVILFDLGLPDAARVGSITRLRAAAPATPIVIMTRNDDEAMGLACIQAGAADFLGKSDAGPHALHRAIVFALARSRAAEIADLQARLELRRAELLGAARFDTGDPADGTLQARAPAEFADLEVAWVDLIRAHVAYSAAERASPEPEVAAAVRQLVALHGGAQDLLEIHLAAMHQLVSVSRARHIQGLTDAARLLAFAALGSLCDRYLEGAESAP